MWISIKGYPSFAKLLLSDQRLDPSADNQSALRLACQYAQPEVVKLLLADKRVDPSVDDLRIACQYGSVEVVKLLLADPRVDPSASEQDAIYQACHNNHPEVVKLLLADQRVDPSANNQKVLLVALEKGHANVVKFLLSDQRVDISRLFPSSSEVLALFLLRQASRLEPITKASALNNFPDSFSFLADIEQMESQRKALLDAHLLSDLSDLCLAFIPDLFCHFEGDILSLVEAGANNKNKFPRFTFAHLSSL
jgi:hypothetical protein